MKAARTPTKPAERRKRRCRPSGSSTTIDLEQPSPRRSTRSSSPGCRGGSRRLAREVEEGVSTVVVYEGWDAAGKGGRSAADVCDGRPPLPRHLDRGADRRGARAPLPLALLAAHPARREPTIFDRSWYGRVLVERVEGFAKEEEWRRAYPEINEFEEQLAELGIVLSSSGSTLPEEQLRRFEERQKMEFKQHKITDEDWRNREKWSAYESAINEMVVRTSTHGAPWTLVSGNDKKVARLTVLTTLCNRLEEAL